MKTGLFGGTFDPIHIGHLIVAETVRSNLGIDRMVFIPVSEPPHKPNKIINPYAVRFEMVKRAIEGYPRFEVSDAELRKGGISYTIDTITSFRHSKEYERDELYLLIGSDNFLELNSWKDPEKLLESVRTLVVQRPGFDIASVVSTYKNMVEFVQAPLIEISASEIRQRVHEGKSIRYWVPARVESFIQSEGLYT